MQRVMGAQDELRLGRDALALARIAMTSDAASHEVIGCAVTDVVSILRASLAAPGADGEALQEVLVGLSAILTQLRERSASDAELPPSAWPVGYSLYGD